MDDDKTLHMNLTIKHLPKHTIAQYFFCLLVTLLIASCGTVNQPQPDTTTVVITDEQRAEELAKNGQYAQAAEIYWQLGQDSKSANVNASIYVCP